MKIIQSILVKFQISQYQSSFPYLIHFKKICCRNSKFDSKLCNSLENFENNKKKVF